jgi:hypothetical protein
MIDREDQVLFVSPAHRAAAFEAMGRPIESCDAPGLVITTRGANEGRES